MPIMELERTKMKKGFSKQIDIFVGHIEDPTIRAKFYSDIKILQSKGVDSYERLIKYLESTTGYSNTRYTALWLCGEFKRQNLSKVLLRIFKKDINKIWLVELAKMLITLRHRDSIKPLINIMLYDRNNVRREFAAYALAFLYDKRANIPFLFLARDIRCNPKVRAQAIEGVANLRYKKAIPVLISLLEDKSPEVRFWSIFALGSMKAKKALPKLRELVKTDKSICPGWWKIKDEAKDAIKVIEGGNWPCRRPLKI